MDIVGDKKKSLHYQSDVIIKNNAYTLKKFTILEPTLRMLNELLGNIWILKHLGHNQ